MKVKDGIKLYFGKVIGKLIIIVLVILFTVILSSFLFS